MAETTPDLLSEGENASHDQVVQDLGYLLARYWLDLKTSTAEASTPDENSPVRR